MVSLDTTSKARVLLFALAAAMLALAGVLTPYDVWLARQISNGFLPGDLRRVLHWSEAFAHGLGVVLIAVSGAILDVERRRRWPRIAATALFAGLTANLVKLSVARARPRVIFAGGEPWPPSTLRGWMPIASSDVSWSEALDSGLQSFPSGHTATAVGFACGLACVYPRARWLFVALAVLASLQRIDAAAHYPSDVLVGAAIGCVWGAILMPRRA